MPSAGDPHAVHADLPGAAQVLLAEGARHGGRDGVGEEVHEYDRGDERGGDAHARKFCFAELVDEGGVGEHEDGFGDERAEGGYGEREDAPVQRRLGGVHGGIRAGRSATGRGTTGFSNRVLLCAHPSRLLPAAAAGVCARGGVHSARWAREMRFRRLYRVVRRGRGVPSWWGGAASFAFGDRRHGEVGGAR